MQAASPQTGFASLDPICCLETSGRNKQTSPASQVSCGLPRHAKESCRFKATRSTAETEAWKTHKGYRSPSASWGQWRWMSHQFKRREYKFYKKGERIIAGRIVVKLKSCFFFLNLFDHVTKILADYASLGLWLRLWWSLLLKRLKKQRIQPSYVGLTAFLNKLSLYLFFPCSFWFFPPQSNGFL